MQSVAATINKDAAPFAAAAKFMRDVAANKASVSRGFSAGLGVAQVLEAFIPDGADVVLAIELLQAADTLYTALPAAFQLIKTHPGPLPPVFGGKAQSEVVSGYAEFVGVNSSQKETS